MIGGTPTSPDAVARNGSSRGAATAWLGAASVLLAMFAAAGAGARIGATPQPSASRVGNIAQWIVAFTALGSLFFGVVVLVVMRSARRQPPEEDERHVEPRKVPLGIWIALAILAVVAIFAVVELARWISSQPVERPVVPSTPPASTTVGPTGTTHLPQMQWGAFAAVTGAVFVLAAVALFVARLRGRVRRPAAEPLATVTGGDDASLEDMMRRAEPTLAVRLAYRHMRQVLHTRGVQPRTTDTPQEYARRASGELREIEQPVRRITALYERARFSRRGVDEAAKQAALEAVDALGPAEPPLP